MALCKVYTKFYICQILNSLSYYDWKSRNMELDELISNALMDYSEGMTDNVNNVNSEMNNLTQITNSVAKSFDVDMSNITTSNNKSIADTSNNKRKSTTSKDDLQIYENSAYKRYFVYQDNVYSKVEIQGMVVEFNTLGYEEKNNCRYIIYIDDTTGVIQAIAWKNKSETIFNKIAKNLVKYNI